MGEAQAQAPKPSAPPFMEAVEDGPYRGWTRFRMSNGASVILSVAYPPGADWLLRTMRAPERYDEPTTMVLMGGKAVPLTPDRFP